MTSHSTQGAKEQSREEESARGRSEHTGAGERNGSQGQPRPCQEDWATSALRAQKSREELSVGNEDTPVGLQSRIEADEQEERGKASYHLQEHPWFTPRGRGREGGGQRWGKKEGEKEGEGRERIEGEEGEGTGEEEEKEKGGRGREEGEREKRREGEGQERGGGEGMEREGAKKERGGRGRKEEEGDRKGREMGGRGRKEGERGRARRGREKKEGRVKKSGPWGRHPGSAKYPAHGFRPAVLSSWLQ